jgi:putative Mg2+ transporter-C (MgtC) family protein
MMVDIDLILEFLAFLPTPVKWIDIVTALVCGALIGFERQLRGKPAGIRTSTLVCLGTCIFIRLGAETTGVGTDSSRVLGQVITGIGFLGAGLMLARDGGQITGITSATIIWILAAIGAMIGFDYHAGAILLTLVILCVLSGTSVLENVFRSLRRGVHDPTRKHDSD